MRIVDQQQIELRGKKRVPAKYFFKFSSPEVELLKCVTVEAVDVVLGAGVAA
jgi:hypothetical protein